MEMNEADDKLLEDRDAARRRGTAKLEPIGFYTRQILEAEGLRRPQGIPEPVSHEEMLRKRAEIHRSAPRPSPSPPSVAARYRDVRFATTVDRPDVRGWSAGVSAAKDWVQRVAAGEPAMLALIGPEGTGKSHLAACAVWELFEGHGVRADCYLWEEIVNELRHGRWEAGREVSVAEVRTRLWARPIVWIDEIEATSGTDFDATELRQFSKNRWAHRRSAMVTGNWKKLDDMIGAAAADRYTQVRMVGPSFRGCS